MNSTHITRYSLVFLLSLFTLTVSTTPVGAQAAPAKMYAFTVNTTKDTHDAHPGDGKCADKNGQCSLRAAIEEADALPSGSRIMITLPTGKYRLRLGTLGLTANTITITGAGSKSTLIKGNSAFSIMSVSSGVHVSLNGLTIEGGKGKHGGGIANSGTLSLSSSIVRGNSATLGGGGIWNDHGTFSLSNNSTVSGNSAHYGGGGIKNDGGTLTLSTSTVSGNTAGHKGGGIFNSDTSGTVTVSKSIISHNTANGSGGGIFNGSGKLSLSNSIVSGNTTHYSGGGIFNKDGTVTVSTSTISGNSAIYGGGISNGDYYYNYSGGTVIVSTSTFSKNSAHYGGGGIFNGLGKLNLSNSTVNNNKAFWGAGIATDGSVFNIGTVTVISSTISGNSAGYTGDGGGIYEYSTSLFVSNSTLSDNSAPNGSGGDIYISSYGSGSATLTATIVANSQNSLNCYGTITDGGYNLESGGTCGFHLKSDLHTDPKLGPLRDNGGPTQTMALLKGSKAIDWVKHLNDCPATDQRGYPRPDGSGETACDIGAYESSY